MLNDLGKGLRFVGTGFFLGTQGLIITASHVILEATEEIQPLPAFRGIHHSEHKHREHIVLPQRFYNQETKEESVCFRHIARSYLQKNEQGRFIDIGIAFSPVVILMNGEKPVPKHNFCFTDRIPSAGEMVGTYTYRKSKICNESKIINATSDHQDGIFIECNIERKEKGYPYCLVDMPIHPGSSGAPVFDQDGKVWGICSSSDQQNNRLAWVTPLVEASDVEIPVNQGPFSDGGPRINFGQFLKNS